jgi:hypothetical protein
VEIWLNEYQLIEIALEAAFSTEAQAAVGTLSLTDALSTQIIGGRLSVDLRLLLFSDSVNSDRRINAKMDFWRMFIL